MKKFTLILFVAAFLCTAAQLPSEALLRKDLNYLHGQVVYKNSWRGTITFKDFRSGKEIELSLTPQQFDSVTEKSSYLIIQNKETLDVKQIRPVN